MTTVLSPPSTSVPAEARVVLHGISWELYDRLLAEHSGKGNPRFTYDRGELEIMVLSLAHEKLDRLIDALLVIVALEWDIECLNAGSTTFKREDLEKGFEPDSCFYVQNVDRISGKKELDLTTDPPPDLLVEVEITRSALNKLGIFAAVGIPEVWRYDGQRLQIYRLAGDSYVAEEQSIAFPILTAERLTALLETGQQMSRTAWLRTVRDWARAAVPGTRTEAPGTVA